MVDQVNLGQNQLLVGRDPDASAAVAALPPGSNIDTIEVTYLNAQNEWVTTTIRQGFDNGLKAGRMGLRWHHDTARGTMQLVWTPAHEAASHVGGFALHGKDALEGLKEVS